MHSRYCAKQFKLVLQMRSFCKPFYWNPSIIFRGLDNAGKTTIVKKLNNEDISTISPTLGFQIRSLRHSKYNLNIWDIGGQKTIRSYWRNYFEQTDGLIWVVDSSDSRRLADCVQELHKLLKDERLAGASLLIFANKQDIPGARNSEEVEKVGFAFFALKSLF